MSKKAQQEEILQWEREAPRRQEARTQRGIFQVEPGDLEEYTTAMQYARERYGRKDAPLMPCFSPSGQDPLLCPVISAGGDSKQNHNDNVAPFGNTSSEYFALVHTPISLQEAAKIPAAMKALNGEWENLKIKKRGIYQQCAKGPMSNTRRSKTKKQFTSATSWLSCTSSTLNFLNIYINTKAE